MGLVVSDCTTGGANLLKVEWLPGGPYGVELRRGADDGADSENGSSWGGSTPNESY
jgi:hypothetical protein